MEAICACNLSAYCIASRVAERWARVPSGRCIRGFSRVKLTHPRPVWRSRLFQNSPPTRVSLDIYNTTTCYLYLHVFETISSYKLYQNQHLEAINLFFFSQGSLSSLLFLVSCLLKRHCIFLAPFPHLLLFLVCFLNFLSI